MRRRKLRRPKKRIQTNEEGSFLRTMLADDGKKATRGEVEVEQRLLNGNSLHNPEENHKWRQIYAFIRLKITLINV